MNISEQISSELTRRDLRVNRVASGALRDFRGSTRDLEAIVIALMRQAEIDDPSRRIHQFNRLDKLMVEVAKEIRDSYRNTSQGHNLSLRQLARLEGAFTRSMVNSEVGAEIFRAVSDERLSALADDAIIEGAPAVDWWKRQEEGTRNRFHDEMRKGLLLGESNSDLIRRVGGRRERQFRDGIMQTSINAAERLIRTSFQSVAQNSREAVYKKNDDVVRGIQALATLDTRTSLICIARSGASWDLNTGKPLPESPRQESYPGPSPWHWRCRTQMLSVLKPFSDIIGERGKQLDDALRANPGTQASMDGQVAGRQTFEQVAKGWGEKRLVESLGRGRYELWKDGKISFTDLVDQKGRPLTIEELAA